MNLKDNFSTDLAKKFYEIKTMQLFFIKLTRKSLIWIAIQKLFLDEKINERKNSI